MDTKELLESNLDNRGNRIINYANCGNPQKNSLPSVNIDLAWGAGKQSSRIQSAINSLQAGQILKLGNGIWQLDRPITLSKSNTGLKGSGTTVLKSLWTTEDSIMTSPEVPGYPLIKQR